MPKTVRMTLVVTEELWKRLGHLALEKRQSKNDLLVSLIEKGLKTEKQVQAGA